MLEPEGAASTSGMISSADGHHHHQQTAMEARHGSSSGSSSSSSERSGVAPLDHPNELSLPEGRYSYKMIKGQPVGVEQIACVMEANFLTCMHG